MQHYEVKSDISNVYHTSFQSSTEELECQNSEEGVQERWRRLCYKVRLGQPGLKQCTTHDISEHNGGVLGNIAALCNFWQSVRVL